MTDSDKVAITKHEVGECTDAISVDDLDDNIMQANEPGMGDHLNAPQALMNIIKCNIGTGMLSLPIVLKYAGLWTGLIMLVLCGALAVYMMNVLVQIAQSVIDDHGLDRTKMDYTEAVFFVFKYGPERLRKPKGKIKHTVNLFLIITQIGFCCVYTLFLTVHIIYFFHSFFPNLSLNFYLISFLVCVSLIPLNMVSNMRYFSYVSIVANITTLLGMILVFAYLFSSGLESVYSLPAFTNMQGFLIAFSISVYSFEGISLVLPIQSKMIQPRLYGHPFGVLNVGMVITLCLYLSLAFFGFLSVGEAAEGSITLNVPDDRWFAAVKPLFVVSIMGTYILQFYVPASIFGRLMEKLRCHREASEKQRHINLILMRISLIMFAYLAVIVIPRLDLMISLIGALASSMLAFVIPAVLEMVHLWPKRRQIHGFWLFKIAKNCFIIFIGLVSFVGGTAATLMQLIESFRPQKDTV